MSDRLEPLPFSVLAGWIVSGLERERSILGLPLDLAFRPRDGDRFRTAVSGHALETPFGVAAGPHSQMAQNIVAAWLCGARFVELKTVQTLDRLEIPRPCIWMGDEGYNVEWSQELTVEESFDQYLQAQVLIHALHRRLGFPGERPGVVLNASVGYDLAGLRQPNMVWFLGRLKECREQVEAARSEVAALLPEAAEVEIPTFLADTVTLSTMHGCPPEEIGRIATHLMREWGFHTTVKLNPTLLGPERVRHILHDRLGWSHVEVPDAAFAHDLRWAEAVDLLHALQAEAAAAGVDLSVKLSNTLQVEHRGGLFPPGERSMYLSGRPLHALTVTLASELARAFDGALPMSFAGGADAFNAPHLLAAGMTTVTSCSDLLRPGGYSRLRQYVETTAEAMAAVGAENLAAFALLSDAAAGGTAEGAAAACLANLGRHAERVLSIPELHRDTFDRAHAKTSRPLGPFDCTSAPCTDSCQVGQRVPEYMRLVEARRFAEAAAVIREDNPLPRILGRACTRPCEGPCVRTHYDEPLAIREVKRFATDREAASAAAPPPPETPRARVAVVGAGPCGLAVASELAPAGYAVTLVERHRFTGGMVAGTIPGFRADPEAVEWDLDRVAALGVELWLGTEVGRNLLFDELRDAFDLVVVSGGAQEGLKLGIPGEEAAGVLDGLDLLRAVRRGASLQLGARVGVVGGGDVAMDCARTARRLGAERVAILYRRTVAEMPAQGEELEAAREEGVDLVELVAPRRVLTRGGRVAGLECARMRLGPPDSSGRPRPEEIPGSTLELELDALVVAIGQRARLGYLDGTGIAVNRSGFLEVDPDTLETSLPGVYAGGDVVGDGPATIVRACGDGRRIAAAIRRRVEGYEAECRRPERPDVVELLGRRARRLKGVMAPEVHPDDRVHFAEVVGGLTEEDAVREASRCLHCDLMCSTCVTVCPNRALFSWESAPLELPVLELALESGELVPVAGRRFVVEQPLQVAVLADLCNQCGNCVTFCPRAGSPFRDKPRVVLDPGLLAAERDNAFRFLGDDRGLTVEGRWGGETHRLRVDGGLSYRSPRLVATLDPATLDLLEASPRGAWREADRVDLTPCAIMVALARGLPAQLPHLVTRAAGRGPDEPDRE